MPSNVSRSLKGPLAASGSVTLEGESAARPSEAAIPEATCDNASASDEGSNWPELILEEVVASSVADT